MQKTTTQPAQEFDLLQVILYPFLAVLLMWLVFYVDLKWDLDLYAYGLYPRKWPYLAGIFTAPFLHGSLSHITNNSFPIFMLGAGVLYFYPRPAKWIFLLSVVIPGLLTWLIARPSYHIGASGVVYALAFFVFFSGVFRVNRYLLALSLLVAFLYGSLFFGMFPMEDGISWESHLGGGISGLFVAILYRKHQPTERVVVSELPRITPEDEEKDPYIQRIGDAWKLPHQRENENAAEKENTTHHTKLDVHYHFQPSPKPNDSDTSE